MAYVSEVHTLILPYYKFTPIQVRPDVQTGWFGGSSGMFSDQGLTWPKMSGSWREQKNALYQPLSLTMSPPLIHICAMIGQGQGNCILVCAINRMVHPSTCPKSSEWPLNGRSCALDLEKYSWWNIWDWVNLHPGPPTLHRETPICSRKSSSTSESKKKKKVLYQVGVHVQLFRVPVLIQLQQNTLNGFFLNTAWTKNVTIICQLDYI